MRSREPAGKAREGGGPSSISCLRKGGVNFCSQYSRRQEREQPNRLPRIYRSRSKIQERSKEMLNGWGAE